MRKLPRAGRAIGHTAILLLALAATSFAGTRWSAEGVPLVKDRTAGNPLPSPLAGLNDEDWLGLEFPPYEGLRPRIVILPVIDEHELERYRTLVDNGPLIPVLHPLDDLRFLSGSRRPVERIERLLAAALVNTNRFDVVDREDLERALLEPGVGRSGLVSEVSAARLGQLLGAQFIVVASVGDWDLVPEQGRRASRNRAGAGALADVLLRIQSRVALNIKVIDAASGQAILDTLTTASMAVAINKAVYQIVAGLDDEPWTGIVVDVDARDGYINGGARAGLKLGMELDLLRRDGEIRDPRSGIAVGYKFTPLGTAWVAETFEHMSRITVLGGCSALKSTDLVRESGATKASLRAGTGSPRFRPSR